MNSKTVSAICVAFLVIGLIGVVVAQSHATADQPAKAGSPAQGAPAVRPVDVEWPVLGLVLAGFGVFLLRPRKRATSSDRE